MRPSFYLIIPVTVWFVFCLLVGKLAASWFHRRPAVWILLAILLSPVVAIMVLLLVGDQEQIEALHDREERIRQRHPERKDIRDAALNEARCQHCGADVNPVTGDGLHSPEAEPWLLLCDQCGERVEPE